MEYDFRNRTGLSHDAPIPAYRTSNSSSSMYGPSLYPRVGQPGQPAVSAGRPSPYQHASVPSSAASSSGLGIRIVIKPEYRVTPPPQLPPQMGDITRSNFQFDFDLERKILAEAEKESQNWGRFGLENLPSKSTEPTSSTGPVADPIVRKYIASGLSREAVPPAVAHYGDNPIKVREFANGYSLLREMGFSSSNVAEALILYDNDTDKALAHFLNST